MKTKISLGTEDHKPQRENNTVDLIQVLFPNMGTMNGIYELTETTDGKNSLKKTV